MTENNEYNASIQTPHVSHDWPQANEDYCSCCRQRFLHGFVNIIRIQTTPEKQLSTKGEVLGEENRKPLYKAYLHGSCWKRHFNQQIECETCGGFSKHKKLQDGTMNKCGCRCHTGSNSCGFVLEPTERNIKRAGL